ncbi:hypothetical protein FUA23_07055 [Neolewinella aurantiaca]|uniref:Uncharacterized protein n=1 Tax=Neolewinella aurantiaca TaxID=2602767 RepID=A0A5C7FQX6_9BACT|nr:hypothetical protein [Neolewinella aurantiaca]TXF90270.1 hypothetical protein FUA23_07055 [Neolewinella aurantiaca]
MKLRSRSPGFLAGWLTLIALAALPGLGWAQPLLSSVKTIGGVEVYEDLEKPRHHYYLPGELKLAREENGRPQFQLLQMRYTGTALIGNQGDRGFVNLVQIGVERKPVSSQELQEIRKQLGRGTTLSPLPIANLEAHLVMPLADNDGHYQRIGQPAGLENGDNATGNVWTEKYFTVRLGPHEAELLWDEVEDGNLTFSIGYAFYADAVDDRAGGYDLEGDSASVAVMDDLLRELTLLDSTSAPRVVRTGTIPLDLDVNKWPDMSRKIDLNDGAPPAWAFLEVRCYDFANELRPDLAMKSIEIEATGITGANIRLKPIRFMTARPEEHTRQVRFPYAIDLTHPFRYRVVEYNLEGTDKAGDWQTAPDWASLLDLTTAPDELPYTEHSMEVEADTSAYRAAGADLLEVHLLYQRDGKPRREKISWDLASADSAPLQMRRFFADRETVVRYVLISTGKTGVGRIGPLPVGTDKYLHLRPRL